MRTQSAATCFGCLLRFTLVAASVTTFLKRLIPMPLTIGSLGETAASKPFVGDLIAEAVLAERRGNLEIATVLDAPPGDAGADFRVGTQRRDVTHTAVLEIGVGYAAANLQVIGMLGKDVVALIPNARMRSSVADSEVVSPLGLCAITQQLFHQGCPVRTFLCGLGAITGTRQNQDRQR